MYEFSFVISMLGVSVGHVANKKDVSLGINHV